jgi:restriction system protein
MTRPPDEPMFPPDFVPDFFLGSMRLELQRQLMAPGLSTYTIPFAEMTNDFFEEVIDYDNIKRPAGLDEFGRNLDRTPAQINLADYTDLSTLHSKFADFYRRVLRSNLQRQAKAVALAVSSIITPHEKVHAGALVTAHAHIWMSIVAMLQRDWSIAYQIPARKWEEIIAGAFDRAGFDEVVLTPSSGDHGRDVIARRNGVGSIKIINSVKAFHPGHVVPYDDVRALLGVLSAELDSSKGMLTTTSDFPPKIHEDPFIAPFLPTRLELMNGMGLRDWLVELSKKP